MVTNINPEEGGSKFFYVVLLTTCWNALCHDPYERDIN